MPQGLPQLNSEPQNDGGLNEHDSKENSEKRDEARRDEERQVMNKLVRRKGNSLTGEKMWFLRPLFI